MLAMRLFLQRGNSWIKTARQKWRVNYHKNVKEAERLQQLESHKQQQERQQAQQQSGLSPQEWKLEELRRLRVRLEVLHQQQQALRTAHLQQQGKQQLLETQQQQPQQPQQEKQGPELKRRPQLPGQQQQEKGRRPLYQSWDPTLAQSESLRQQRESPRQQQQGKQPCVETKQQQPQQPQQEKHGPEVNLWLQPSGQQQQQEKKHRPLDQSWDPTVAHSEPLWWQQQQSQKQHQQRTGLLGQVRNDWLVSQQRQQQKQQDQQHWLTVLQAQRQQLQQHFREQWLRLPGQTQQQLQWQQQQQQQQQQQMRPGSHGPTATEAAAPVAGKGGGAGGGGQLSSQQQQQTVGVAAAGVEEVQGEALNIEQQQPEGEQRLYEGEQYYRDGESWGSWQGVAEQVEAASQGMTGKERLLLKSYHPWQVEWVQKRQRQVEWMQKQLQQEQQQQQQGQQGEQGQQEQQREQGQQGPWGQQGRQGQWGQGQWGERGRQGQWGERGRQGQWVEQGRRGQWGEQGHGGQQGRQGQWGEQGRQGLWGEQGRQEHWGQQGELGQHKGYQQDQQGQQQVLTARRLSSLPLWGVESSLLALRWRLGPVYGRFMKKQTMDAKGLAKVLGRWEGEDALKPNLEVVAAAYCRVLGLVNSKNGQGLTAAAGGAVDDSGSTSSSGVVTTADLLRKTDDIMLRISALHGLGASGRVTAAAAAAGLVPAALPPVSLTQDTSSSSSSSSSSLKGSSSITNISSSSSSSGEDQAIWSNTFPVSPPAPLTRQQLLALVPYTGQPLAVAAGILSIWQQLGHVPEQHEQLLLLLRVARGVVSGTAARHQLMLLAETLRTLGAMPQLSPGVELGDWSLVPTAGDTSVCVVPEKVEAGGEVMLDDGSGKVSQGEVFPPPAPRPPPAAAGGRASPPTAGAAGTWAGEGSSDAASVTPAAAAAGRGFPASGSHRTMLSMEVPLLLSAFIGRLKDSTPTLMPLQSWFTALQGIAHLKQQGVSLVSLVPVTPGDTGVTYQAHGVQQQQQVDEPLVEFLRALQHRLAIRNFPVLSGDPSGSDGGNFGHTEGGAFGLAGSGESREQLERLDVVGFMDGLRVVGRLGSGEEVSTAAAVAQALLRVVLLRGEELGCRVDQVRRGGGGAGNHGGGGWGMGL